MFKIKIVDYDNENTKLIRTIRDNVFIKEQSIDPEIEFDGLDTDILGESTETLWVTALDETDYMLGELLHDMLDKMNAALAALFKDFLDVSNAKLLAEDTNIYGFDAETGIRLDFEAPQWIWKRIDNGGAGTIQIKMHNEYGYSLNIQQGDFTVYDYRLG